jgi:hypothetical protein
MCSTWKWTGSLLKIKIMLEFIISLCSASICMALWGVKTAIQDSNKNNNNLSLRDKIAIEAMNGELSSQDYEGDHIGYDEYALATFCYNMADIMIQVGSIENQVLENNKDIDIKFKTK